MLSHLALLGVLLAIFLLASRQGSSAGSYETTVSAFKVHERRHLPAMEDAAVRRAVARTFAGIPQHGPLLGDPGAPVTMRFIADPECPEARVFAIRLLPRLVGRWVRDGRLRIEYVGESAETVWPEVFRRQQVAVLAAGRQGRLWQYLEFFYHYQGPEYTRYVGERYLEALAKETGLKQQRWATARRTFRLGNRVERGVEFAAGQNIVYTPAFLIGPTGGRLTQLVHFTLTEPLAFEEAFREALAARSAPPPPGFRQPG